MSADCLFCKIAAGEIPAKTIFENDDLIVFRDIAPQAPTHWLLIPRKHFTSVADSDADAAVMGRMLATAGRLANQHGLTGDGFRLVTNTGAHAGQSVDHFHIHLLAGRPLQWPPG